MERETPPDLEAPQEEPASTRRFFSGRTVGVTLLVLVGVGAVAGYTLERQSYRSAEFCASCHNMEAHVESYLNGNHMDAVHRKANVGCKDCHSDYSIFAEVRSGVNYVIGNYEKPFSRRRFGDEMCVKCHISLEYHADRTDYLRRNPHKSHWPQLRCGSCHLSHDKQINYCARCHDNGGQRMTAGPIVPRTHNPWANARPEDFPQVGIGLIR